MSSTRSCFTYTAGWWTSGPVTVRGRSRFDTFGDVNVFNLPNVRTDCPCCARNIEMIKLQIAFTKNPTSTGRTVLELFHIYSRAETMPCADCEGLKITLRTNHNWMFDRDDQGFIVITTPMDYGIKLLQDFTIFKELLPNFRPVSPLPVRPVTLPF